MRRLLDRTWQVTAVWAACVIFLCPAPGRLQASGPYNGPGGGEYTIEDGDIVLVDGPGDWIIWGVGQDVSVRMKNGPGNLTLRGFKNITLTEKNGGGKLIVEEDNGSVSIRKMDGPGHAYIRCKGRKRVEDKNGEGNIYLKHSPPIVVKGDGPGKAIREP